MYQRASSFSFSPSSCLFLELRTQHAEHRNGPGITPGHMYRREGVRVIVQNPVVAPDPSWGSWLGSVKRSPSGEPGGRPRSGPGPRLLLGEPLLRELPRNNNTVSSQGCRAGAQPSHRLGGLETQARACGGSKSPGSSGLGGHGGSQPGLGHGGPLSGWWLHLNSLVTQEGFLGTSKAVG